MTDPIDPTTKILTRRTKNELKQITKLIRETNYILTQTTNLQEITTNLNWKYALLEERSNIITETIGKPQIPTIEILAREILKANENKQARRFGQQLTPSVVKAPIDITKPIIEQLAKTTITEPVRLSSKIVPQTTNNTDLKETHHHYVGFYSKSVLPKLPNKVLIKTPTAGVITTVVNEPCINMGYSGNETIITEQPIVKIDKTTEVPPGSLVVNTETNEPIGAITSSITLGKQKAYPVQDGFRRYNAHLAMKVERATKIKPIAYADKQFDNKQQLMQYLNGLPPNNSNVKATLLTDKDNMNTQLIIHEQGRNIANIHLRHRLIDIYNEQPPYKPYTDSTCHREGF